MISEYEFETAIEELNELDINDDSYTYYYDCLMDMYHDDKISAKNGKVGYKSVADLLKDARSCGM